MKKTTKEEDTKTSKFTTVNLAYARVAMILLAVNLCLTGYALTRIADVGTSDTTTNKQKQGETVETTQPEVEGGE